MSDNKVGPSRERCWLTTQAQLLETKVTAVCTGTGEGRPGTAPVLQGVEPPYGKLHITNEVQQITRKSV